MEQENVDESLIIPLVISPREYRLYRWYSLMKEKGYKIGDYVKYALHCKMDGTDCYIGRVHAVGVEDNASSVRTSVTISSNDGPLYQWIKAFIDAKVVKKSSLIKSIVDSALELCDSKEEEDIPGYADITIDIILKHRYERKNRFAHLVKQNEKNSGRPKVETENEETSQNCEEVVVKSAEDTLQKKESTENEFAKNEPSKSEPVEKEQESKNTLDTDVKSSDKRQEPNGEGSEMEEMRSFLSNLMKRRET